MGMQGGNDQQYMRKVHENCKTAVPVYIRHDRIYYSKIYIIKLLIKKCLGLMKPQLKVLKNSNENLS